MRGGGSASWRCSFGDVARLTRLLVVSAVTLGAPVAHALELSEATAIVTGTEEPERSRGMRQALVEVIVRLTGDDGAADDPRVARLLDRPQQAVASFAYEDRLKGLPIRDEQGTRERPHLLRVRFDEAALVQRLREQGFPLWATPRPTVMVALLIESGNRRFMLSLDGADGATQREVLLDIAQRRGLPVELPASVAIGGRAQAAGLATTAASLLPDVPVGQPLLSGSMRLARDGYWAVDWSLRAGSGIRRWSLSRVTFDEAFRSGVRESALTLSGRRAAD